MVAAVDEAIPADQAVPGPGPLDPCRARRRALSPYGQIFAYCLGPTSDQDSVVVRYPYRHAGLLHPPQPGGRDGSPGRGPASRLAVDSRRIAAGRCSRVRYPGNGNAGEEWCGSADNIFVYSARGNRDVRVRGARLLLAPRLGPLPGADGRLAARIRGTTLGRHVHRFLLQRAPRSLASSAGSVP